MRVNIILLAILVVMGCGTRPARDDRSQETKDAPQLTGSWQHIFDQDRFSTCDPNIDCKCADVINFYDGGTFERNLQCSYSKGNFELKNGKLQLNYISAYPQIFMYEIVNINEITLVKDDTVHMYIRKPFVGVTEATAKK